MKVHNAIDLLPGLPAAPAAGITRLFRTAIANRQMPSFIGPSGLDSALQPFLGRAKVGIWQPSGNSNVVPGVFGYLAHTPIGTATARNIATGNLFQRMRRLGYVSSATAGNLASGYVAAGQITTGTTAGSINVGGFFKVIRFGCSDAAAVSSARMFVGIGLPAAPTNVEPSTLVNHVGIGHGAADANLKIFYGGSAAQTPIDLGANFPKNTLSTDVYELCLFCAPGSTTIYYHVTRLNTGDEATGTLTGTVGTQIPDPTTLLSYSKNWRSNNTQALAVGLDIFSDYIETDQ